MAFDIDKLFGAVTREVRNFEYRGHAAAAVILHRTFDTTVEDLWNALTTRERIDRWLTPVTGELRLGGRFQLEGNAGGEVLECDPPRHLAVTWEFGGGMSWVEVYVRGDGERARLELQHIAPSEPGPGYEHWKKFGPGAVGVGWDLGLIGLDHHLRTGGSARAEGAENAPELKPFMRRAAEDWGRAHAASGEPEEAARAAAASTAAFYTGEA